MAATVAPTRFSHLSASLKALVRLFQTVNFGSILRLQVENGQPVLDPPPELFFDLKLDRDETARPEIALADFELCAEIRRLLQHLRRLESGVVQHIEIQAGIPRRILVSRPFATSDPETGRVACRAEGFSHER